MGALVFGAPGTAAAEVAEALRAAGVEAEAWDGTEPCPEAESGESLDAGRWRHLVRTVCTLEAGAARLAEGPAIAAGAWAEIAARQRSASHRSRVLFDTSHLSGGRLSTFLSRLPDGWLERRSPVVVVESFSFAQGVPLDLDCCLDARGLRNPYWEPALRPHPGTDPRVSRFVLEQPLAGRLLQTAEGLVAGRSGAVVDGRPLLRLGIGCTGGRHRSVAIAEELVRRLGRERRPCLGWHRDVDG